MSITRRDILDHPMRIEEQLEMSKYWDETQPYQKDPRAVSPLEMVREYHKTADLPLGIDLSFFHIDFRLGLIEEEVNELNESFNNYLSDIDKENSLKELADVVYVVYGAAATFGWDLDEAVRRVHENNMGRMYQDDGTIKRREDGKIMKNKNYPKVDLSDLV